MPLGGGILGIAGRRGRGWQGSQLWRGMLEFNFFHQELSLIQCAPVFSHGDGFRFIAPSEGPARRHFHDAKIDHLVVWFAIRGNVTRYLGGGPVDKFCKQLKLGIPVIKVPCRRRQLPLFEDDFLYQTGPGIGV